MNSILTVASKEFYDGLRNRWLLSITFIFAIFSLGLSYYGSAASGIDGISSLNSTIASLSTLAVFLIPLIALLVSYDSFVGEKENGTLLLLLTYPITKGELLLGKFIGQGGIITVATLLGFGIGAVVLTQSLDTASVLSTFTVFISTAILLGLSFTAIAFIISLVVTEKSKAAGLALIIWFVFALVFDLVLLAALVGMEEGLTEQGLNQLMMFNPTDIFGLTNLSELALTESTSSGTLAIAVNSDIPQWQLYSLQTLWIAAPLAIAFMIFKRQKL
jgi:Cu-processing system permease protein